MPSLTTILSAIKIVFVDVLAEAVIFTAYACTYNGMFVSYCLFQAAKNI